MYVQAGNGEMLVFSLFFPNNSPDLIFVTNPMNQISGEKNLPCGEI